MRKFTSCWGKWREGKAGYHQGRPRSRLSRVQTTIAFGAYLPCRGRSPPDNELRIGGEPCIVLGLAYELRDRMDEIQVLSTAPIPRGPDIGVKCADTKASGRTREPGVGQTDHDPVFR